MNFANKYRVKTFEEIQGNKAIVKAFKSMAVHHRIPDMLAIYGRSGTCKTNLAYMLIKAARCENLSSDGEPCCQCTSCKDLDESLFATDEPFRNTNIYVFSMAIVEEQEQNMRRILSLIRSQNTRTTERFIIINEFHNCSIKIQQELLVPTEHMPQGIHIIITTTDYYSNIAEGIRTRVIGYESERISSKETAERLKEVADAEGIKITKEKLTKLARVKNNNMRECLNMLEQLQINMSDNWNELMKNYSSNLEELIKYLQACEKGIIDLVEYIAKHENKLSFIETLAVTLKEALFLKYMADDIVEPDLRKRLNKETGKISDKVLIETIRDLVGAKNLLEDEAASLMLVIGTRFNASIFDLMTYSDTDNSVSKSKPEIRRGNHVDLGGLKDFRKDDNKQETEGTNVSEQIEQELRGMTGEVDLEDILGGDVSKW